MRTTIPQFMGAHIRRREDPALLTGEGKYVADIALEGAVSMALVRSPYAHARVRSVDASRALHLKGVLCVLTAEDIHPNLAKPLPVAAKADGGKYVERYKQKRYLLATDRVRHVGEAVAVVLAEDPYVAADAVEAVSVDYEPLEVVVDPEAALEDGAPQLHEDCPRNRGFVWELRGGDVEAAFRRAAATVELRARIQRLIPNAMEPRAVAATYDTGEGAVLWSSTQFPHMLRDFVAGMLGLESDRLRVIAPEVGGGFGAKANVYAEEVLAVFLARHLRRPVRWSATRSEDYVATSHGRDQIGTMRLAADANGRVLAAGLEIVMDVGAYFSRVAPIIPPLTGVMATGVYDIENVEVRAVGAFTNKAVNEPYRGAGRPEATYFLERAMDVLAAKLSIDPTELRRRNFIAPGSFPYATATGLTYDSGEYARALDEVLKHADYRRFRKRQEDERRRGGRLLGIGVASYVEICGFGPFELGTIRVGADGKVTVLTGTSPHGQGHETSWAQIAAATLQVPLEDVEVLHGDTKIVPAGVGTFGSRSAAVGGSAVHESSETVREGAKELAAQLLEAAAADMRLEGGRFFVAGLPSRSVTWKEVAAFGHSEELPAALRDKLRSESRYRPQGETYPFGAHACVVDIDRETGEIRILRFVTVDDCGNVINPVLVEGQVHGGIAQGIGQALWEGASYDESGNLVTGNLMEYALPRADLLPRYETNRTETPTPLNPLGVKGIGEAATIGSTPAVVNAVVDALAPFGIEHVDTPLTPERIWEILRSASA